MSESDWNAQVAVYFEALKIYSPKILTSAFRKSIERHPDFMPTVGQLQSIALEFWRDDQKKQAEAAKRKQLAAHLAKPASERRGKRPEGEVRNAFDLLARAWFDESERLGLDPDKPTPRDIGRRRLSEFWSTWNTLFDPQPTKENQP
jgi:hypothetical protein